MVHPGWLETVTIRSIVSIIRISSHRTAAFYCSRQEIMKKWNSIPRGIDVLITSQPALGHGDADYNEEHLGDVDLLGRCKHQFSQNDLFDDR